MADLALTRQERYDKLMNKFNEIERDAGNEAKMHYLSDKQRSFMGYAALAATITSVAMLTSDKEWRFMKKPWSKPVIAFGTAFLGLFSFMRITTLGEHYKLAMQYDGLQQKAKAVELMQLELMKNRKSLTEDDVNSLEERVAPLWAQLRAFSQFAPPHSIFAEWYTGNALWQKRAK